MHSRRTRLAMLAAVAASGVLAAAAHAAPVISESFSSPISAPWTTTVNNGGSLNVAGGKLVAGISSGASAADGQNAYIQETWSNATDHFAEFHTTFQIDVSNFVYTQGLYPSTTTEGVVYEHMAGGNNPLSRVTLVANEYQHQYVWRLTTGVQWGGGQITEVGTSPSWIAANPVIDIDIVTDIVNNGGLNWTITTMLTGTSASDTSQSFTATTTTTANAVNSDFDPLNTDNTFALGIKGFSDAATPDMVNGMLSFDDFAVSGPTNVPEPASLGLLALGGLALLRRQ